MQITQVSVERVSAVTQRPFAQVVEAFDAAIGHPDMRALWKNIAAAHSWNQVEETIHAVLGSSGFMEFTRFNMGPVSYTHLDVYKRQKIKAL